MGGLIDIDQKGCESVFHDHDSRLFGKDLPDSDRGIFKCRHASTRLVYETCCTYSSEWILSIFGTNDH